MEIWCVGRCPKLFEPRASCVHNILVLICYQAYVLCSCCHQTTPFYFTRGTQWLWSHHYVQVNSKSLPRQVARDGRCICFNLAYMCSERADIFCTRADVCSIAAHNAILEQTAWTICSILVMTRPTASQMDLTCVCKSANTRVSGNKYIGPLLNYASIER